MAGWDEYVRARDRFLARARSGLPRRDEMSEEATRGTSQPPRDEDVGLRSEC
jgi:hypothetical protein